MVNIDCLIFGYRRFFVPKEEMARAADILLKNGISVRIFGGCDFAVRERQVARTLSLLSGAVTVSVSEVRGAYGFFLRYRRSYGVFAALLLLFLLTLFLGGRVFDIRIAGDGTLSDLYVEEALAEAGLSVGVSFSSLDLSEVEGRVLRLAPRIAWLNINRRGSVAYLEVIGRADTPNVVPQEGYANLVAAEDAWIEEIAPRAGEAVVRVGESVKAGDLLISGLTDPLCHASGSVRGRVRRHVEVLVPFEETVLQAGEERTLSLCVNFFGFSLNIFKTYGNPPSECDIIEETDRWTLFGSVRLPISVSRRLAVTQVAERISHTETECTRLADSRLASRLRTELADAELLSLRTRGEFTREGYRLYADALVSREIGTVKEFQAKE